jgi:hypothetical protein
VHSTVEQVIEELWVRKVNGSQTRIHPQSPTTGLMDFQPAYPRYNLLYLQENNRLSTAKTFPY